jgi:anti-sigma B factor antagonist
VYADRALQRHPLQRHFQIEVSTERRGTVLTLHGELDVASSTVLEDELHRVNGVPLVIVDLTKLEFIDSTGLGVLVKTHQHMRDDGNQLALVEGGGQVRRLLELTGLSDQLTVVQSLADLLGESGSAS